MIVAADGDDRVARMHGGDEFRRRTVGRTVMADFETLGVQIDAFGEEIAAPRRCRRRR